MYRTLLILAAICGLAITSCDNRAKIEGSWESSPVKLDLAHTATSSATLCYTFNGDGSMTLTSDINLTEPMNRQADGILMEYQASVAATASIQGTWQYAPDENDEVIISLDNNSFTINVDPAAVTFSQNVLDGAQTPEVETMKQQAVERYQTMLTPAMKAYFGGCVKLDDIKVDKNFLNCEIGDKDYILRAI